MAVFFVPAARKPFRNDFPKFLLPLFQNFFRTVFSGADSAEAGKIRTALFYHPAPEHPMKFLSAAELFLTSVLSMTKLIHRFHSRL
jgi:hypothetical protein